MLDIDDEMGDDVDLRPLPKPLDLGAMVKVAAVEWGDGEY